MIKSGRPSAAPRGGIAADAAAPATFTGNRGAADRGAADLRAWASPAAAASTCRSRRRSRTASDGLRRARRDRPAGPLRAAGGAPLHAPQPEELRHRHGRLSAGLVHHEAQPAPQREGGAAARLRRPPSAAAGLDRAGRAGADRPPGALAEDADRHAGRGDVAGGRRAWRAVRHDGDPRRARGHAASGQRKRVLVPESAHGTNPATAAGARLSPSSRSRPTRDGRVDLAALKAQARRPTSPAIMLTNPNTCGLFETRHHRDRRGGARGRRLLLLRRRQLQRHRRPRAAGRSRRRRHAHQPAQDLLDAAWRRRAGRGAGGAVGGAGALRARIRGS